MATFSVNRVMRFGDCDPAGIAYFPRYFDMMNGVVEEWWSFLGHPWQILFNQRRIGVPTVHLEADFRAIAQFADPLTFTLAITGLGSRSVDLAHKVNRGETTLWTAAQVLVATSLETHKSIPWPEDIRAALQSFQEAPHV
jgi:4-hydroxybenzoyl-CoA thioesterase